MAVREGVRGAVAINGGSAARRSVATAMMTSISRNVSAASMPTARAGGPGAGTCAP